jgi:hypothetical protein
MWIIRSLWSAYLISGVCESAVDASPDMFRRHPALKQDEAWMLFKHFHYIDARLLKENQQDECEESESQFLPSP